MRLRRIAGLLALAAGLCLLLLPAAALALGPVTSVAIQARVQPDGAVAITERRAISDPRPVEFLEFLVPEGAEFDLALSDQKGSYTRAAGPTERGYQVQRSGTVVYVEWQDSSPARPQEVTFTYQLKGGMVIHSDAVEWYWPAVTGSGGRTVSRLDAVIDLPYAGQAYLYAYGGSAGGVKVTGGPLRVSAADIGADRSFEWRLLLPRTEMPQATGRVGSSRLAALVAAEEARIAQEMSRAERLWVAHWLLTLAPLLLAGGYWFFVRRFPPEPEPQALSPADLTAVAPAVVGWVYDAAWFDYACAQLLWLERRGCVRMEWKGSDLELARADGPPLSAADEALLDMFRIKSESRRLKGIAEDWWSHRDIHEGRRDRWLKLVGELVPPEWFSRPRIWWPAGLAVIYAVDGVMSGGIPEWLGLWAVAALFGLIAWKRRWLSPLGESHIARWVSTYYKAMSPSKYPHLPDLPAIDPEYFLAVEVGGYGLQQQMGEERYKLVKELYEHLEEE